MTDLRMTTRGYQDFTLSNARDMSPLRMVMEIPQFLPAGARVVDIGAGSGRNTLFLARNGFQVDAIDSCAAGINELNEYATAQMLPVRAMVYDIRISDLQLGGYDLILCTYTLHYLTPERATSLLTHARQHTTPGSFHLIGAIIIGGDFSRESSANQRFYPSPGEIRCIYEDEGWIIHRAYEEESKMAQAHPDGSPMVNLVSFVIAQKPF